MISQPHWSSITSRGQLFLSLPGLQRPHDEHTNAKPSSSFFILALLYIELINNKPINNCFILFSSIYLSYKVYLCIAYGVQTKGSKEGGL